MDEIASLRQSYEECTDLPMREALALRIEQLSEGAKAEKRQERLKYAPKNIHTASRTKNRLGALLCAAVGDYEPVYHVFHYYKHRMET